MNYGLYLSASGVLTNLYRQDVLANNLANAQTVGYKPDVAVLRPRQPESIEGGFSGLLRNRMLDRIGGGADIAMQRLDLRPGPMQSTGSPLDIALEGSDTFLVVSAGDDASGQSQVRLTRDGRLSPDAQGYLATTAGGHRLLDTNDQPIQLLPNATAAIDRSGRLIQNNQVVAQLQIARVTQTDKLTKAGSNLLTSVDGSDLREPAPVAGVKPGFIEASSVDPIKTLMQLTETTKAVTEAGNLIRYHDLMMDRAVNTLGRVG